MSRLLLLGLLLGQETSQGPGASDEARCFEYLEQGRFSDLVTFLETLPKEAPCRATLEEPSRRLVAVRDRLVAAINRNEVVVDLKDVHPQAARGGRILSATSTTIKVQGEGRERSLIWAALPPGVTLEMARRFLAEEAKTEPTLLDDLAEGLGLGGSQENRARAIEKTKEVRKAIGSRSFNAAWAAAQSLDRSQGPWPALASAWAGRLKIAMEDRETRIGAATKALSKGASWSIWEDFEEGPELVSSSWQRGLTVPSPEGGPIQNRWCRRSVFVERGVHWGEMLDQVALPAKDGERSGLRLRLRTILSCRVWGVNVNQLDLWLHGEEGRQSIIAIPLPAQQRWVDVRVRLDDFSRHRAYASFNLVRMGEAVSPLVFKAQRADAGREDGTFYLDDVRVLTLPEEE